MLLHPHKQQSGELLIVRVGVLQYAQAFLHFAPHQGFSLNRMGDVTDSPLSFHWKPPMYNEQ